MDGADVQRAVRMDRGTIGKFARTPSGGARIPGRVAKADGVLVYVRGDGSTVREFRPASEAFAKESLDSLEDAVVTVGHPPAMVTPETAKTYAAGMVKGPGEKDGAFVGATLAVIDGEALGMIERGEVIEISSGYVCDVDPTPGTSPSGERYDAIQRNVRYNHVALLPRGAGRAGAEVALRMDSRAAVEFNGEQRSDDMETETIDGISYKVGSPEWRAAKAKQETKLRTDAAEATTKFETEKARADALATKLAEAEAKAKAAEEKLAAETSETALDARADARASLIAEAREILGPGDDGKARSFAGQSSEAIRQAVVAKRFPGNVRADGKAHTGDALLAVYALAVGKTEKRDAGPTAGPTPLDLARSGLVTPPADRNDAADVPAFYVPDLSQKWRA